MSVVDKIAPFKDLTSKSKELWKALKSLGLLSEKRSISNISLKKDGKISFDDKTNINTFKEFFCYLGSDLVARLPPRSNKVGISVVRNYYLNILGLHPSKFKFSNITEDVVLKLLKSMSIR